MHPSSQSERELTFLPLTGKEFWPPWSFESINQIIWNPTAKASQTKTEDTAKGKDTKKGKEKNKSISTTALDKEDSPTLKREYNEFFCDVEIPILPRKYLEAVITWKRPHELFADVSLEHISEKVFICSGKPYELHMLNEHLEYNSYFNHILDAFESLGAYKDFESLDFDEFGFNEWRPTNYIYAIGNVQKEQPHEVLYNPYGKYVVRLYHCGKWRQIQIDDRIPVDYQNRPLIPSIFTEGRLELWPILITKAILKLNHARLYDDGHYYLDQRATHQCRMYDGAICTCKNIIPVRKYYLFNESDVNRFNAIHLLTGWYPDEYEFSGKRCERVWDVMQNLLPTFECTTMTPPEQSKTAEKIKRRKKSLLQNIADTSTGNLRRESKPLVTLDIMLGPNELFQKRLFMEVNCSLIRDIPLEETGEDSRRALPLWKTYRWIYWAAEKGIWKPEDTKIYWSLLCSIPEFRQKYFIHLFEHEWQSDFFQKEQIEANNVRTITRDQKKGTAKKAKSEDAKKRKSEQAIAVIRDRTNSNVWLDFNKLLTALEYVKQYLKNHHFTTNIIISNEDLPSKMPLTSQPTAPAKPTKKGKTSTGSTMQQIPDNTQKQPTGVLRIYGDEKTHLYLFVDSEDCHEAVIDLTVLKDERNIVESKVKFEKYRWNCMKLQTVAEIATSCMDGCKICLPKGRAVYRIAIRAKNFCLHIRTNCTNVRISDKDEMFELMAKDGVRYETYISNIIKCMKAYIQSIGEPEFVDNMSAFFSAIMEYSNSLYGGISEVRTYVFQQLQMNVFKLTKNNSDSRRILRRILISRDPSWSFHLARCSLGKEFSYAAKTLRAIKCDCPGKPSVFTPNQEDEIRQCAALKVQSFMKMIYVKKLLRYHDQQEPNRKYNEQLKNDVAKLLEKYCSGDSQHVKNFFVHFLFNNTFKHLPLDRLLVPFDSTMRLAELYDFFDDFHFTIRKLTKTYNIPFTIQPGQWYPLKIGCLFCHSEKSRRYMLCIKPASADSKFLYYLKVLNNDDLKLVSMSDHKNIWSLIQNRLGYKIFTYVYIPLDVEGGIQPTDLVWILEIISPRHAPSVHFCNYCNDTLCPCDQPTTSISSYPLQCVEGDLQDPDSFDETNECSPNEMLLAKYQIKAYDIVCISIFMSCSSDLYEFEINVFQTHTRDIVASETGTGKVSLIGLYLKPISGSSSYNRATTDFSITINCLRRLRVGSQVSHRSSEAITTDHTNNRITSGVSNAPDQFTWNVKIAYDKGSLLKIERLDAKN